MVERREGNTVVPSAGEREGEDGMGQDEEEDVLDEFDGQVFQRNRRRAFVVLSAVATLTSLPTFTAGRSWIAG